MIAFGMDMTLPDKNPNYIAKRKKIYRISIAVFLFLAVSGVLIAVIRPGLLGYVRSDSDNGQTGNAAAQKLNSDSNTSKPRFYCPLDGLPTTEEKASRRPIAVLIENHPDARPQSNLSKACTVYETVSEGGITRFLAIYLHEDVEKIGPVRSARAYFISLAKQYNALFSHCGGPAYLSDMIKKYGVADLDEFLSENAYWRVGYRKKPHNLYTSTDRLRKRADMLDYRDNVFYQKPNFKPDLSLEDRPESGSISINFSKPSYKVKYVFDRKQNTYKRYMAGKAHIDGETKKQITPKNVIIQYTSISNIAGDTKGRMNIELIGTGHAIIFRDGRAIECRWHRPTLDSLTKYYDGSNQEIRFNRGQTWIELVDKNMPVLYQ